MKWGRYKLSEQVAAVFPFIESMQNVSQSMRASIIFIIFLCKKIMSSIKKQIKMLPWQDLLHRWGLHWSCGRLGCLRPLLAPLQSRAVAIITSFYTIVVDFLMRGKWHASFICKWFKLYWKLLRFPIFSYILKKNRRNRINNLIPPGWYY